MLAARLESPGGSARPEGTPALDLGLKGIRTIWFLVFSLSCHHATSSPITVGTHTGGAQ